MIAGRCLALAGLLYFTTAFADYNLHPRAPELLALLRSDYGFSASDLEQAVVMLGEAVQVPKLIENEQQAKEKTLTWDAYRRLHVTEANLVNGVRFLNEHAGYLARAEAEYGVPPAIIAAIMGVETKYGTYTGRNRVLDALATQGFDHPTRSGFFFRELAEFFAMCRDFGFTPVDVRGSYAGAVGAAQFMPSNYRRLALDYDNDGAKDLWTIEDAIGSIANYLVNYAPARSWQRGAPLIVPTALKGPPDANWPLNAKTRTHVLADFLRVGLQPSVSLPPDTAIGLLELTLSDGKEYWLGFNNFYAVMSYNPRVYYAMAVTQLAEELQRRSQESAP